MTVELLIFGAYLSGMLATSALFLIGVIFVLVKFGEIHLVYRKKES